MFIGYPRSGHTLYGALLDAHKNCVISHELNVLQLIKDGRSRKQVINEIIKNSQFNAENGRKNEGYSYEVKDQWQGRFTDLQVVGDKQGGRSSRMLSREPELLDLLYREFKTKIKLLHVYRNPFDNLASRSKGGKLEKKDSGYATLFSDIEKHFIQAEVNDKIRKEGKFEVIDIKHEDFIADPKNGLIRICHFLDLEVTEDYLNACASIVFPNPHKTRHEIDFPEELIGLIDSKMKYYDFLKDYSFND